VRRPPIIEVAGEGGLAGRRARVGGHTVRKADIEAIGMVYSSSLVALPEALLVEVTAARLAGDAHRIRGAAVWRVAADV